MPTTEVAIIDFSAVPPLADGLAIQPAWRFLVENNLTGEVTRATQAQVMASLTTAPITTAPPTVSLDLVPDGTVGILLNLTARATAAGSGTIVKVEFFSGAFKIGQVATTPYVLSYTPTTVGQFPYTAKATDSFGNSSTDQQLGTVNAPVAAGNLPPVVSLAVSTQQLVLGQSVVLTATARDPDGSIARVEYFDFSDKVGETTALPYVFSAKPTTLGTHVYSAKATDNLGLSTACDPLPVVVIAVGLVKPDAPTNVIATAGNSSVTITATPPVNQGSSAVINYQVFRNGSGAPLATSVALPFVDITAVNNVTYFYELMAHNTAGDSVKSTRSNNATPAAPAVPASSYHGAVTSPTPVPSDVQALTAEQWATAPRTMSAVCNGTYPCFAEPASYPVRAIIFDGNGYNITGDVAFTTALFSVGGAPVSYNVYTHRNAQYDPNFIFSL